MKLDKPLIAMAIGVFSAIMYELFMRVIIYFGIGKYSLYQLDSLIVTVNRPISIVGFFVSSAVSCFIAVILYYSTNKLGTDYMVAKAIIATIMLWVILEALFTSIIEGKSIPVRPASDYYTHIIGSIIFGASLGLLFKKYLLKK